MDFENPSQCEFCDTPSQTLNECKLCESFVCTECFSGEGICDVCVEAKCTLCGEYLSTRACNKCGRLVCIDCGVRLNEVTTCMKCQAK